MKEAFEAKSFRVDTLVTINQANEIIADYQGQGFKLTLRQLYYQFVAKGLIANKQSEYKRLGSIVNDARLAGKIDWDAIEDRTRELNTPRAWSSPESIVGAVAQQYQEDLWRTQDVRPEVWVEKEALIGVFEAICEDLRVPYFACRGYTSQSLAYEAGKRFERHRRKGQRTVILHFGDHDPSGLDMTRDNRDRVWMFARDFTIDVRRLALNRDQIDRYDPPPNPAKETDARFAAYMREHGDESWELDALDPAVLAALVRDEIDKLRDPSTWTNAEAIERNNRELLQKVSDEWEGVVDYLS